MSRPANQAWMIEGSRHQGESINSRRVHLIDRYGIIFCGAVPRQFRKATVGYLRGWKQGQYGTPCRDCKPFIKDAIIKRELMRMNSPEAK